MRLMFVPHLLIMLTTVLCVGGSFAQTPESSTLSEETTPAPPASRASVPDVVDQVERGLRLRLDLGGRYMGIGNAAPPITLEVAEPRDTDSDVDLTGMVIFGYDRPFGMPLKADLFADMSYDANGEGDRSPFFDANSIRPRGQELFDQSALRTRLYSAFVGLSLKKTPVPVTFNIGRQTQMVDSPISYDGGSVGTNLRFGGFNLRAKLWGGLDAFHRLADDPFTRKDTSRYQESFDTETNATGGVLVVKEYGTEAVFNPVGGIALAGEFYGIGLSLDHTLLAKQRTKFKASYRLNTSFLTGMFSADVRATEFFARSSRVTGDVFLLDGSTRIGTQLHVQFFEDEVAYDGTFAAFNPEVAFDAGNSQKIEEARRRDNIRYLNFAPPKPHVLFLLDGERTLMGPFSVNARTRLRHHFDEADVDLFRTNVYEGGVGVRVSASMALAAGVELVGGVVQTGPSGDAGTLIEKNFDYLNEGLQSYIDTRVYTRSALLDGQLNWMNEAFIRRQDLQTRSLVGSGQWSGAFATTLRYDIFEFWSLSARVDADLLSPFDGATASTYFAAHAGTSLQF